MSKLFFMLYISKTTDTLNNKPLKKLFARKRVKQYLCKHRVVSKSEIAKKLKALNLMTSGSVLKGTFLCLAEVEQIRSVSQNAQVAKFFSKPWFVPHEPKFTPTSKRVS